MSDQLQGTAYDKRCQRRIYKRSDQPKMCIKTYLKGYLDRYIDRCIGRYIDRYSIDPRPTRDRRATDMSLDCRPRVERCFARASTDVGRGIDRDHIGHGSTTDGISVNYRRNVGCVSFDSRARVYRYYLPIYPPILSKNISTYIRYYLPIHRLIYRPILDPIYRYHRPMYGPIY